MRECQSIFGYKNVAILSNSAGGKDDKDFIEADQILKLMDINVIKHQFNQKPKCWQEIKTHFGD